MGSQMRYLKKYLRKIIGITVIGGKLFHSLFALIGVIFTIYVGWKNFNLSDLTRLQNYEIGNKNISLTENKIKNEEFQENLKNLSSDNLLIRIGAISILENIARNYPLEYYWPTVHVFTSYIRHHCDKRLVAKACHGDDIQEVIGFLSEGEHDIPHKMSDKVDLSNVMLSNIDFSSGKLRFSNFQGVILNEINFSGTNLSNANFKEAIIYNSWFSNSDLHNVNFSNASIKNVNFFASNLEYAQFSGVSFKFEKDFPFMQFLESNVKHVSFCTGYDLKTNRLIHKCASGLVCHSLRSLKLYDTVELPSYLLKCGYKIEPDPFRAEIRKAFNEYHTSGNPKNLYDLLANSGPAGRLIYYHRGRE